MLCLFVAMVVVVVVVVVVVIDIIGLNCKLINSWVSRDVTSFA